ncbi:uncharacterized protein L201_005335 [Kwoniella dendrophila CBS 6074]|uniref:UDP-glycosyltransferases domain-containing protein n=1 Tax=Kwoniella dendrophila CBS 6074 TaxID=1295534 RepID=A0AAX4JYD6_9TREE
MTIVKPSHFVVVPLGMWGHLRPLLHLSLNLLHLHSNLHLTILIPPSIKPRVDSELKSNSFAHIYTKSPSNSGTSSPDKNHHLHHYHKTDKEEQEKENKAIVDRLQIITCISEEFELPKEWSPETMAKESMDYAKTVPLFLKSLLSEQHNLDHTINKFQDIPPNFMIFDTFQAFIPDVMKSVMLEIQKPMVPLIAFVPSNASATWHHFAKEENGGFLYRMIRLVEEDIAKGRDPLEAYAEHSFATYGQVRAVPGLPTKYDYEWWPNMATVPMPPQAFIPILPSTKAVNDEIVTGLICPTAAEIEPVAVEALEKELGKRIYMVGPQFPDSTWAGQNPERKAQNEDDGRVYEFLDKMKGKYGSKSVIYVSLGSLFFPAARPELIRFILQTLKECSFPFVFAYASALASIPEDLLEELNVQEDACVVKFAPQWDVLNHEAIGYFLSHCGSNSTAEAVIAELPIMAMPFTADQGEFTALLSEIYKVAIDLKQIKTFSKPEFNKLYDGTIVEGTEAAIKKELKDTFEKIRGEEGKNMRQRMKDLKAQVRKSWENGRSKQDMLALGRCFE